MIKQHDGRKKVKEFSRLVKFFSFLYLKHKTWHFLSGREFNLSLNLSFKPLKKNFKRNSLNSSRHNIFSIQFYYTNLCWKTFGSSQWKSMMNLIFCSTPSLRIWRLVSAAAAAFFFFNYFALNSAKPSPARQPPPITWLFYLQTL